MLEIKNITWDTPSGVRIIDGLSLTVPDGMLTVITGPNGGGKTTLAKLIAGIEIPLSGKILLDGEDITEKNVTERANLGISFAFQQPVRFKGITVRKLLEIAKGVKITEGQICEYLSEVGLCARNYINREVDATLSGGEIKRIEIAMTLARNTRITLFDEPEAGIDLWSFKSLIDVFDNIRKKHERTMLIISHQERILRTADNIVVVSGGKITKSGDAKDIIPELLSGREVISGCTPQENMF